MEWLLLIVRIFLIIAFFVFSFLTWKTKNEYVKAVALIVSISCVAFFASCGFIDLIFDTIELTIKLLK